MAVMESIASSRVRVMKKREEMDEKSNPDAVKEKIANGKQ